MPLSTVAALEQYCQIDITNDSDPAVLLLLDYAQAIIETHLDRTLEAQTAVAETLDGRGDEVLFLSQWPVTAVTSVTEDGDLLTVDVDFYWYPDGRLVRGDPTAIDRLAWSRAKQNVDVVYDHGYATIPKEIELVSTQLAGEMFKKSAAYANAPVGSAGIRSISLDGSDSVEFNDLVASASGVDDLSRVQTTLLAAHQRVVL